MERQRAIVENVKAAGNTSRMFVCLGDEDKAAHWAQVAAHLGYQMQPELLPAVIEATDRELLRDAFCLLRRRGWTARMNFACCSTCGHYELSTDKKMPFTFFNRQANNAFDHEDLILDGLYLQWSESDNNAYAIVECLEEVGLEAEWDGHEYSAVLVIGASRF